MSECSTIDELFGCERTVGAFMSGPLELRERLYSDDDIEELLLKAQRMGLNLDKGSDLNQLEIGELERLVTVVQ